MNLPGFTAEESLSRSTGYRNYTTDVTSMTYRTKSDAQAVRPAMEKVCTRGDAGLFCCYWANTGKFLACDRDWHD
jgi:hypothetical protein